MYLWFQSTELFLILFLLIYFYYNECKLLFPSLPLLLLIWGRTYRIYHVYSNSHSITLFFKKKFIIIIFYKYCGGSGISIAHFPIRSTLTALKRLLYFGLLMFVVVSRLAAELEILSSPCLLHIQMFLCMHVISHHVLLTWLRFDFIFLLLLNHCWIFMTGHLWELGHNVLCIDNLNLE